VTPMRLSSHLANPLESWGFYEGATA